MSSSTLLWSPTQASVPVDSTEDLFPVRRIYCVGRNYLDHIREMQEGDERDDPFFFQKPTDAIVQDGESVPYPPGTTDLQYEGELVVAIGTEGADISVSTAWSHIFGLAAGIDLTRRDLQKLSRDRAHPWEAGKSFDHSAPCGPLLPLSRVSLPFEATLLLHVNGTQRQSTSLAAMIWDVPEIVSHLSHSYRLMPGDLIYTGTPAGVAPVEPGDSIRVDISGLPALEVTIGERAYYAAK